MSGVSGVEVGMLNRPMPDNFVDSLRACVLYSSRDWGLLKRDAWLYGVVVGWDKEDLERLAKRFNWGENDLARLEALRFSFASLERMPSVREEGNWL